MLNKLNATPTCNFQPIRLLDPSCSYKFKYLMTHSADPDQLASSSQLNWIYTVCKGRVYPGSAGQGLNITISKIDIYIYINAQISVLKYITVHWYSGTSKFVKMAENLPSVSIPLNVQIFRVTMVTLF